MKDQRDVFEKMGVEAVRLALKNGKLNWEVSEQAVPWLAQKDHERNLENSVNAEKQLEIARSASEAAWAAVTQAAVANSRAQTANIIATLAMIAAVVTIAISIITALLK
ncbi:hypothetical protein [Sphingobium sp. AntQ-1]|uniref:hypothetical protein n=1 Tax=Sphingobium sp. AntQ-1 TaxID=2930091 RepID=UPI00234F1D12|nr:hypothetical protein [Sphingobium sp. AntQ-1]